MVKLRILRWEFILDYLGGSNTPRRILIRGKQEGQRKRSKPDVRSRGEGGIERKVLEGDRGNLKMLAASLKGGGRGH